MVERDPSKFDVAGPIPATRSKNSQVTIPRTGVLWWQKGSCQMPSLTLFIFKKFHDYNGPRPVSNGLRVSCLLIVEMLMEQGFNVAAAEAIDGNSIDALVAKFRPKRVVIEAIWVTPEKMAELQKLWPHVEWTVRVHSEIPFLSNEGCAIERIAAYRKQGIEIAFNSFQTVEDFNVFLRSSYLPNYYPPRQLRPPVRPSRTLNIGCFGAIRPLKNQLIQAFAAISYAEQAKKKLNFHMNGSRIEQSGSSNLKNIQALFDAAGQTLILHPWMDHHDFMKLLETMDMCMAVSLSESFCITAADAVSIGVPLVASAALEWIPSQSQAPVNSVDGIVAKMKRANCHVKRNKKALESFSKHSICTWKKWMNR